MWMLASGGSAVCLGVAARLQSASQTRAPSSGVIIDFHLTGIRTLRSSPLGRHEARRQAAKILGKLGPEKFLEACRGYLDLVSSADPAGYRHTVPIQATSLRDILA